MWLRASVSVCDLLRWTAWIHQAPWPHMGNPEIFPRHLLLSRIPRFHVLHMDDIQDCHKSLVVAAAQLIAIPIPSYGHGKSRRKSRENPPELVAIIGTRTRYNSFTEKLPITWGENSYILLLILGTYYDSKIWVRKTERFDYPRDANIWFLRPTDASNSTWLR